MEGKLNGRWNGVEGVDFLFYRGMTGGRESKIRPRREIETVEKRVSRINSRLPADSIDGRFPSLGDGDRNSPSSRPKSIATLPLGKENITGAKNDSRRIEFYFFASAVSNETKKLYFATDL